MTNYDKEKYYSLLENYLNYCNVAIQKDGQMRCPNHAAHKNNDDNFSAHLYYNNRNGKPIVKCFSCGFAGDIYDVAGILNNEKDFIKQYKIIDGILGSGEIEMKKKYSKSGSRSGRDNSKPAKYVAVERGNAHLIFCRDAINESREKSKYEIIREGKIKGTWYYTDKNNDIIALDVRFELFGIDGKIKKTVTTYWYDGRKIRSSGKINLIYN